MLILSRKTGERIFIGQDVAIVVTRIKGNRVTLGIEAPDGVPIRREELDVLPDGEIVPVSVLAEQTPVDRVTTEQARAAGASF